MRWFRYEWLSLNRDKLTRRERRELKKLDREDELLANEVADRLFPGILVGWCLLVVAGGVIILFIRDVFFR